MEKRPKDGEMTFNPIHNFVRERDAYAHLLHYGVCAAGAVPRCFGWFELSASHVATILDCPGIAYTATRLRSDTRPARALVLEFVEDAVRLSAETITMDNAVAVVRGESSQEKFASLAQQNGGMVPLDSKLFREMTAKDREWSATIQFTALGAQFKCAPCK